MNELEIYPRFKELLPPLTSAEMEQLEQSVLAEGIREPIKVWQNKIVDGHNRYELAQNYNLPFPLLDMRFENEDAVCEWMIINQLGRRNLEAQIKTLFIGQLYELQKKRHGGDRKSDEIKFQNVELENQVATVATWSDNTNKTADKVAEEVGVSPRTVRNAAKVYNAFEEADDETKQDFQAGKISQKTLVEKSAPKKETEIDSTRFDSFTNNAKHHGGRIAAKIKELEETIDAASLYFGHSNNPLKLFAERLAFIDLDKESHQAKMLKRLEICPNCAGDKCARCEMRGYLDGEQARLMREAVEYQEARANA